MATLRAVLIIALAAGLCACGTVPRTEGLDVYLDHFAAVKASGEDIYLKAAVVAEGLAPDSSTASGAALAERKAALDARLAALRLIDRYNRVLTGLANGEDPKILKSHMHAVGKVLSSFSSNAPGAGQSTFALAAAVPYLGTLIQGASFVQDAVAKKRFLAAVAEAEKPIVTILDILVADTAPLEELLNQDLRRDQDPYRTQGDSLGARFYRQLQGVQSNDAVKKIIERHNSLRQAAGRALITHKPARDADPPTVADLEALESMTDQAHLNWLGYRQCEDRLAAQRAFFERYRGALQSAQRAMLALNKTSEQERETATKEFNDQAVGVREESVRLRENR